MKDIDIPEDILKNKNPLIGIYLSSGVVCEHHFYFNVDKNLKIRGFFNVDYEIPSEACL